MPWVAQSVLVVAMLAGLGAIVILRTLRRLRLARYLRTSMSSKKKSRRLRAAAKKGAAAFRAGLPVTACPYDPSNVPTGLRLFCVWHSYYALAREGVNIPDDVAGSLEP